MKSITILLELLPRLPTHWYLYLWNLYPPFLGAGIRIRRIAPDFSSVETTLRLRWWNRNVFGTLFGGSLYAMCDPVHVVMLIQLLGPRYVVRDRGAEIRFLKKGTNAARAFFQISPRAVAEIWNDASEVQERQFQVNILNNEGEIIAQVVKTIHIRRKGTEIT